MSRQAVAAGIALALLAAPAALGGPKKDAGPAVLVAERTKTAHCTLGVDPDHACSPGAYSKNLTQKVVCSKAFRTGDYRSVSTSLKHAVEAEYGLKAKSYGSALEIDHIVSLELGGSNDIANLYPERAAPAPGYHVKDKLENTLHKLVCTAHTMTLRQAQRAIATNWRKAYVDAFGLAPS